VGPVGPLHWGNLFAREMNFLATLAKTPPADCTAVEYLKSIGRHRSTVGGGSGGGPAGVPVGDFGGGGGAGGPGVGRRAGGTAFPFSNPTSIQAAHIPIVKKTPYWITEKSDGLRVALLLVRTATGAEVSYLMDRRGQLYGFPVQCIRPYFDGSVFDAELVQNRDGSHTILVFDVGALAGDTSLARDSLGVRLEELRSTFPSPDEAARAGAEDRQRQVQAGLIVALAPGVSLAHKVMARVQDAAAAAALVAKTDFPYPVDGHILTPDLEPCGGPGTAKTTLKVKLFHTLDLLWMDGDLWLGALDQLLPVGSIAVHDLPPVTFERKDFEGKGIPSGTVVEVVPGLDGEGPRERVVLRLSKVREDRDAPNLAVCVIATLRSALDDVRVADILG